MKSLHEENNKIYEAPAIETLQIEMEQNILGGSGTATDLPTLPGTDW